MRSSISSAHASTWSSSRRVARVEVLERKLGAELHQVDASATLENRRDHATATPTVPTFLPMEDLLDIVDAALAKPVEVLELRVSADLVLELVYDGGGPLLASWRCGSWSRLAELSEA